MSAAMPAPQVEKHEAATGLQQEAKMRSMSRSVIGLLAFTFALGIGSVAVRAADPTIPGVSFNGGDGSYKRVLSQGITLGISNDPPYTFQDESTKEYDGIDVRIFREICKRLAITKVKWEIVQFDALIPGIGARRWDVVVDNLHENPKRLAVVAFTSPAYWYGSALAVQKGNPKNIHTSADMAGHSVGTVRGSFNQGLLEKRTDLKEMKLYTSNEAEFADLIAGRVDVIMEDDIKIGQFMKNHPEAAMELATGYEVAPEEYGYARYALAKDDVDLNHAVSRALDEMRGDGSLRKIIAEFGLTDRNLWYYPVK
jgi:polar amino acid transport system substrate-binding protein